MRRDLWFNLVLSAGAYLLPLAGAPSRLVHPAPWLALTAAIVTLFTQPALTPTEMSERGTADRRSALWIFAAMFTAQLAAILQFGYFAKAVRIGPLFWVGLAITAAGLVLRIWSIRTLGRFFTSTVAVQPGQHVVEVGPYRLLRHPSYTGAILTALGTCGMLGSGIGAAAVLLLVGPAYLHRIRAEEAEMTNRLGVAYSEYTKRTRRLVPFVF